MDRNIKDVDPAVSSEEGYGKAKLRLRSFDEGLKKAGWAKSGDR